MKPKTVQQWIRLRRAELRRIEKQGGEPPTPELFLVPPRVGTARQLEFTFEGPQTVTARTPLRPREADLRFVRAVKLTGRLQAAEKR